MQGEDWGDSFFWEGMTMRYGIWTALTAGLLLTAGGVSQGSDTVRLGGPSAQAAIEGGTDNELVRYGHGHYGGGRGYYGGGRGYYGGYYGGFYGRSYYRPYYASYSYYRPYYRPYVYSYYPSYYGASYYSPYYASYYYPCAGTVAPTVTLQTQQPITQAQSIYQTPAPPRINNVQPMPPASDSNTFPYNGGPNQPIPMPPQNDGAPISSPRGIIPLDGKLESLPRETGGGVSPVSAPNSWTYVRNGNTAPTVNPTRIAYPAYGENAVPTPRKTSNR